MYFVYTSYILRKKEKFVCVCVVLCTKVHLYSHSRGVCVRVEKTRSFFYKYFFHFSTHNKKKHRIVVCKKIYFYKLLDGCLALTFRYIAICGV